MKAGNIRPNLKLREAVRADKELIEQVLNRVRLPVESLESGVTAFFVAEEDKAFVGVAGFEFYGKDALLRSVAVAPELQNKGLGNRIVDSMISIARDEHIKRIVLLTETAEKFFRKKGFNVVVRSSIDNVAMMQSSEFTFACPTSAVCMVLPL